MAVVTVGKIVIMEEIKFDGRRIRSVGSGSLRTSQQILDSAKGTGIVFLKAAASVVCPVITAVLLPNDKPEELLETGASVSGILTVQISDMSNVMSVSQDGNLANNPISFASGKYHWDFTGASPLLVSTEVVTSDCGTVVQVFEIAADGVVTTV